MQGKLKTFRVALMLVFSLLTGTATAQTVNGNVVDETGEPIIGATVMEKGTKNAAITDFDGNFTIKMSDGKTLVISYIGMITQEIKVAGKSNVNVVLREDANTLEDVVVVGYGTMKKQDLTGAISSVSTDQLNAKGAPSVMENLQGSVPGVNITQNSSRAGGGFDFEIRGLSTFGKNRSPLYVVDGMITDDINWLNPQDIERIDILKDASSTAIYGSRATNGVVIVSTKSAKEQGKKYSKPNVSYDGYYGVTKTARMPDFMTGSEFAQYRHFRYLNVVDAQGSTNLGKYGASNIWGMTQGNYQTAWLTRGDLSDSYVKDVINSGKETDWIDLFLRNAASQQNHFISVSGNGGNVNYHFGVGYQKEEGIYEYDEMQRFNLKGTVDSKISDYLTAGISFNGAYTDHNTTDDSAIANAFRLNPLCRAYDDDGNIIGNPGMSSNLGTSGDQFTSTMNPLLDLVNSQYNTKTYQFLANIYVELKPIKNLSLKTTFSPNYVASRNGQFEGTATAARNNQENRAYASNSHKFQWTWDNQINYNLTAGDHSLGLMGLFSTSAFNQESYSSEVYDVLEQAMWWNLGQAASDTYTNSSSYTEWSMMSWAGRLNYSYKDRYLLTATIRWDGSSRFQDGHRWGSFPSAAAAWRITEESFMANTKNWLSNLKLRFTFGTTGNNYTQGSNYATSVTASGGSLYYGFADGTGVSPYYPSGIVNKALTWEKTTEYNVGLDFGFFNNRINGTIDWYTKNSKNLLIGRLLPYEAGGITVIDNVGKVKNTGFEIALNTVNIQTKDWNWTTSFTFAHNKNEVIDVYGNKQSDIANSLHVGESIHALYNYVWNGIVDDREMTVPDTQIAREKGFTPGSKVISRDYYFACYGWGEGMPIVEDLNGDGAIDAATDKKIVGKSDPDWTGSINSALSYKNWDFSFSIYTKQGYEVYSPFYKQYTNYGDRGMQHIAMDFYIPDGALLSCDYDANGNRINEVYQQGTHYGSYPFPTNQSETAAGVGTVAFSSNGKDGADNMSTANGNSKGAPYQIVDASYWKVKNISLGYTFPKKMLDKTKVIKGLRLYVNITNPFVFGTDYKGYDPEWAASSLSAGGPSTVTYQFGGSIKF